jgi:hypothetical protein
MAERFDVAFSLAREQRSLIEPIAEELRRRGRRVFYYGWPEFQAALAVPNLDIQLRHIYGEDARLVVPVLSADYERKPWTGNIEFTVVREFLLNAERSSDAMRTRPSKIMALKTDDARIEGFASVHGYIDIRHRTAEDIANLIELRLGPGDGQSNALDTTAPQPGARTTPGPAAVPALPRWLVSRTTDVARITQALAAAANDSASLAVAVVGMPGVGKTTLLKMACQPEARPAGFQDVVWITVGRDPRDLVQIVRESAMALGARPEDFSRDDGVISRFRELLREGSLLVTLDDVWDKAHVKHFLVNGSGSRVMFSSRDRSVAIALGAHEVRIDTMEPDQAVQLIQLWAGKEDAQYPAMAKRLGYHPLALRLAGIQLHDSPVTAAEWLAQFNELSQLRLDATAGNTDEDVRTCFALTLQRLSPDEQQLYYSLGIFPFEVLVPVSVVLRLWRQMGKSAQEAREMATRFERLGLLEIRSDRVWLHDLLRQYAREELGHSARTLHWRLLQSYGVTSDSEVPPGADGYYQTYSAYHFKEAGVRRGGGKLSQNDILGWVGSLFTWRRRQRRQPGAPPVLPATFPDNARVAFMGSWGTGMYGAPVIAQSILASSPYDLLLHLGDIYKSGTEKEVRERFLRFWPGNAATLSRAIPGNHEMYSGGIGYFDHVLPAFGQQTSYFSFANARWLLIFLDSAYVDADLGPEQRQWLRETIAQAGTKSVLMFSHHYRYTAFDMQLPKLQLAVASAVGTHPIVAWYWAHEHQCVLYDRANEYGGVLTRCIGHGGFPSSRTQKVRNLPVERETHGVDWKRFNASQDCPSGVILDGPNPYMVGEEDKYPPHGYATLEFNGAIVTERVHLADGRVIFQNDINASA